MSVCIINYKEKSNNSTWTVWSKKICYNMSRTTKELKPIPRANLLPKFAIIMACSVSSGELRRYRVKLCKRILEQISYTKILCVAKSSGKLSKLFQSLKTKPIWKLDVTGWLMQKNSWTNFIHENLMRKFHTRKSYA